MYGILSDFLFLFLLSVSVFVTVTVVSAAGEQETTVQQCSWWTNKSGLREGRTIRAGKGWD